MSNQSTYPCGVTEAPDPRPAALAALHRWATEQATARPRLVAEAWAAGCTNVAELARTAGVSRDTIYADLTAAGIDYQHRPPKEPTMSSTTIATGAAWHHPHFIAEQRYAQSVRYTFRPFTGDEPEPVIPDHVSALLHVEQDHQAPDAPWQAYGPIADEVHVANTLWRAARYHRAVAGWAQTAVPVYQAYRRAIAAADAAYAALDETPDGQWRTALLRLVDARTTALDAARRLDAASDELDALDEDVPERVLEQAKSFHEIARDLGVDLSGWHNRGDTARNLERTFRTQDDRINEVRRLAGDTD